MNNISCIFRTWDVFIKFHENTREALPSKINHFTISAHKISECGNYEKIWNSDNLPFEKVQQVIAYAMRCRELNEKMDIEQLANIIIDDPSGLGKNGDPDCIDCDNGRCTMNCGPKIGVRQ